MNYKLMCEFRLRVLRCVLVKNEETEGRAGSGAVVLTETQNNELEDV